MSNSKFLRDSDPMPFGKFQGKAMIDVPASYLLWMYDNGKCPKGNVYDYIWENLAHLRKEVADAKNSKLDNDLKNIE